MEPVEAVTLNQEPLRAWCNGLEVVAATSKEEAVEILLRGLNGPQYTAEELEDYAEIEWHTLDESKVLLDEEGKSTGKTVGELLRENGKPGHLWSIEP